MSKPIPTVKIADPHSKGQFIIINKSDFDAELHELFDESKGAAKNDGKKGQKASETPQDPPPGDNGEGEGQEPGENGEGPQDPPAGDPPPSGEGDPPKGDPDAGEAVDLREVPVKSGDEEPLAAAVAEVEDVELLETLLTTDNRKSARPVYEARIAELKA